MTIGKWNYTRIFMNPIYRKRVAELLETGRPDDPVIRLIHWLLTLLIGLNVMAVILESVAELEVRYYTLFLLFERASVAIFTLEYGLRVWSYPDLPGASVKRALRGRLRYMRSPYALIDLAAILPFYMGFFIHLDLRFLRVIRLLRIFKFTRYSSTIQAMLEALRAEASTLAAAFFLLFILFVLASSGIYLIEQRAQPEDFGSIPAAMWWAMATLTTVGYGDVIPITPWGKFFGGCITIIGVGMVALPAGIIASGFSNHLKLRNIDYDQLFNKLLDAQTPTKEKVRIINHISKTLHLNEATMVQLVRKLT
jgi:voltage-gated potassium channel